MELLKFKAEESDEKKRLDAFLSEVIEDRSRSHIQGIIEDGNVTVNGQSKKSKYKLKVDDDIEVRLPDPVELEVEPEDIDIDILYEDSDIVIVNKEQDMVVHPAPGNYRGTLVNALLYHCNDLSGINGVIRPGIVHRIDKDTSGVLVIAKNDNAHNKLAEQFKEHSIIRTYVALVEGVIKKEEGTVDAPIARHPNDRIRMAIVKGGRRAVTHYRVLERFKSHTLVQCNLETGRTHQIRVHMAHIGHPLVGDPVYGFKKQKFNLQGQALHAKKLGLIHPTTGEYIEFDSELPENFKKLLKVLRNEL